MSDELFASERLAAIVEKGKLNILDPQAYEKFIDKYERDRLLWQKEGRDLPSWKDLINS